MTLTTDELAEVRTFIGDTEPPTTDTLNEIFSRRESVTGVVREVLTKRLADLLARPTSFSIPGEYSESRAGQVKETRELLTLLGGPILDAEGGLGSVLLLEREDPAR